MQIIMSTTSAGPDGVRNADTVHSVPADEGIALIKAGAAKKYSGKKAPAKISISDKAAESAQLAAAESAEALAESEKKLDDVVKAADEFKKESAESIAALEKVANDAVDELATAEQNLKSAKAAATEAVDAATDLGKKLAAAEKALAAKSVPESADLDANENTETPKPEKVDKKKTGSGK